MYHVLCLIGVVIGLLLLFIARCYGEKISDFFEMPHKKFELKQKNREEEKAKQFAKKESEMQERLEKAKLARAKAKARNKTKTRKK